METTNGIGSLHAGVSDAATVNVGLQINGQANWSDPKITRKMETTNGTGSLHAGVSDAATVNVGLQINGQANWSDPKITRKMESTHGNGSVPTTVTDAVSANGVVEAEVNGNTSRFTFSAEPSVEEVRRLQAEFAAERAWGKFHQPRNLLLALVGEVGEVAELFQWRGEVAEGLPDWSEAEREHLGQELSDVFIYLVELAEKCHVDLPQAVLRKMALNRLKYPASKVHGSAKKYTEYQNST